MTSMLRELAETVHNGWAGGPGFEVGAKHNETNAPTPRAVWTYHGARYQKPRVQGPVEDNGHVSTAFIGRNAVVNVYLWGGDLEATEKLVVGLLDALTESAMPIQALGERWPTQQRPELLAPGELAIVQLAVVTDLTKGQKPTVVILGTETSYDWVNEL